MLWVVIGALMVILGSAGGLYLFFHQAVGAIRAHSLDVKLAERHLKAPLPGRAAIALVIGNTHRANEPANQRDPSDTIMLLRADPQTNWVSLLSLPRDLVTNVICPGQPVQFTRINAAYSYCGSKGTVATVRALTGLPINYLITVNFRGFKEIVNDLGGIWLDIDRRYYHSNHGLPQSQDYAEINLQPGYQRLTGGAALDFVRFRHSDSDLFRIARQQAFVKALKQQISHSFSALSLPKIVGVLSRNLEVGVGGGSKLSDSTVLSWALFLYELPGGHFFQARLGDLSSVGPFGAELSASPATVASAVQQFVNPDVSAPLRATQVALGLKVTPSAPPASATTVTVLNGNGVAGSAAEAGSLLGQRGYRVLQPPNERPANAPAFNYFHTKIYYDPARRQGEAAAQRLAALFAPADIAVLPAQIVPLANGAMCVVTVGSTFHNSIAAATSTSTPITRQRPFVSLDPQATLPLLRPLQRRLPFQLEVPTVLESDSVPDPEMPVRLYSISAHEKALRLVFRRAAENEYWGIEEVRWTGAPILAGRSFRHTIGGREFDLYYSGPHVHMVVLHAGGASYWVVNTLLDSLSNDTMLAIAKGFRPLGAR